MPLSCVFVSLGRRIREELGGIPDCAWDVDQGVSAIQNREEVLVAVHEPLLYTFFFNWE